MDMITSSFLQALKNNNNKLVVFNLMCKKKPHSFANSKEILSQPFFFQSLKNIVFTLSSFCGHGLQLKCKPERAPIDSDNKGILADKILSQRGCFSGQVRSQSHQKNLNSKGNCRSMGSLILSSPPSPPHQERREIRREFFRMLGVFF